MTRSMVHAALGKGFERNFSIGSLQEYDGTTCMILGLIEAHVPKIEEQGTHTSCKIFRISVCTFPLSRPVLGLLISEAINTGLELQNAKQDVKQVTRQALWRRKQCRLRRELSDTN